MSGSPRPRLGVVDDPLAGPARRAPAGPPAGSERLAAATSEPATGTVFARVPGELVQALRLAAAQLSGGGARVTQQQLVAVLLREALEPLDDAALDRLRSLLGQQV